MLKFLRVKNFALMDELTLNFNSGLTIITGETGAGKSLIVDAIAALTGERIDDVSIRTGRDYAEITGVFVTNQDTADMLRKYGLDQGEEMIVRRRIERGKRQFAYVNDQLVSLARLKEITQGLLDLVGQHENQSLFNITNHLKLLDRFAGLDRLIGEYRNVFTEYNICNSRLVELQNIQKEKALKLEALRYDIDEIEKADLKVNEEQTLNEERNLLQTGEKRASLVDEILPVLYEDESSAYEKIAGAVNLIEQLSRLDQNSRILNMKSMLEVCVSNIEEVYRQLVSYREHIDFSRERFEEVMGRLDLILRLKKKYRKEVNEIIDYLNVARQEFDKLQKTDVEIEEVQNQLQVLSKKMNNLAHQLSEKRKNRARNMEKEVIKVLKNLGMERAQFQIRFSKKDFSENGIDDVEFYISTNPGEELKPLSKVGSGGEISRITLGLKTILSGADHIPTIIFDEVDTGIGGRIAEAVGELLHQVSNDHQIICITHLPQISIFADDHIMVKKDIKQDTTMVNVVKLDEKMRKMEIARMLGGKKITRTTLEHAEEILKKRKQSG